MRICLTCGELTERSYCEEHFVEAQRASRPAVSGRRRTSGDSRWKRLSRKARKLQPFCSDCGATEDLQLDHTPETWQRIEDRLPIRLEHTGGVVCGPCNRARGDARTDGGRGYRRPEFPPGAQGHSTNLPASNIGGGGVDGEGGSEEGC